MGTARLKQDRRELALGTGSGVTLAQPLADVTAAALVDVGSERQMVLEVTVPDNPSGSIADLETMLSEVAEEFARVQVPDAGKPRWVNRTMLLDEEAALPGWIVGQTKEIKVEVSQGKECSTLTLGWANNTVSKWSLYSASEKAEIVQGLVDAQCIWIEAASLSEGSLLELNAHASRLKVIRDSVGTGGNAGQMLIALAMHNVAYDDVLLNLQGYRREVAQSALEVWKYGELMSRISRRIEEVHRLEVERLSERRSKYENLVGTILLGVGLISAAQLVLAVIQTAFSGGTADIPGGRGEGGLMVYFRNANIDLWMWGSLASVVLVFIILVALRRGVR